MMHDNKQSGFPPASRLPQHTLPGEIITFGSYPQTAAGTDKTPIQWRILEKTNDELFILSEYILDCKRYHHAFADTTWQDSTIRKWLKDEFYHVAFSPEEKDQIITTHCAYNGGHSPDTDDKVFLLSVAEIKAFTDPGDGPMKRRTTGTAFARAKKADGCCLYVYDKGIEKDYIEENGEKKGCSWWWTRTQLQIQEGSASRATFIGPRSNIKSYGQVDIRFYGVRPALKMKIITT